nr:hypothetical protein [uncultured Enterobacter sp.]
MNYLRLIIDREKHSVGFNCAIDADLVLPLIGASLHASGYRDGLTKWHAESIMRRLLRLLEGLPVKATITDHTQRKTQVYTF